MENTGPLRLLFLEENQSEIKIVESILNDSKIAFEAKTARTENDFIKHVNRFQPDIIIAGSELSKFSVHQAVDYLKERQFLIPIILIVGNISDEMAKEYLKYGVDDYLTKYNLLSLPGVMIKAIEAKKTLREKLATEELFKSNEAKLQTFYDNNPEAIFELGFSCEFLNLNKSAIELLAFDPESKSKNKKYKLTEYLDSSDVKLFKEAHASVCRGQKRNILLYLHTSKKNTLHLDCKLVPMTDAEHNVTSVLVIGVDVTEKVEVSKELSISKNSYENLVSAIDEAMWSVDLDFNIIEFNERAEILYKKIKGKKISVGLSLMDFAVDPKRYDIWLERYQTAMRIGKCCVEDLFLVKGEKYYAQITLYPIYFNQQVIGISVLAHNITNQKKAEEELKNSEELFRSLSENAPVGIFKADKQGNFVYANSYLLEMFGTKIQNLMDHGWMQFIAPEILEEIKLEWKEFVEENKIFNKNVKFYNFKGEAVWTQIHASLVINEEGTTAIGTITDVTALKVTNDKLVIKQKMIDTIESNSKIGFWSRKLTGKQEAEWSDVNYSIYERDRSLGPFSMTDLVNTIVKEDRDKFLYALNKSKVTGIMDTEYRILTPSNRIKHLHATSFTIHDDLGMPIQLNGATIDVTDKYQSKQELDKQNKVIQNTLDIAHIGLWELGLKDRTTMYSKETKKILGLREYDSSLSFEVFIAMIHPEDRNSLIDFYNKQALGIGPSSFEYRIYIHGQIRNHIIFSDSIRDENNKVSKLSGVLMDVTKARKAEVGLKESEKLFNSIFENTEDAVFIEDEDGNILNVNAKACRLLNMTRAKLVGSNILDLTPAGEEELVMKNHKRLFDQEITEHTGNTLKNSGEKSSVEIKAKRITYHSTPALLLNVREKK